MKPSEDIKVLFRESAEGIVRFSSRREDTIEKWSDQKPVPDGRTREQCIGFMTKQEFSDDINIVMDILAASATEDKLSVLRIWAIRTELNANDDEIFNQIQLTFRIEEEVASREISKGDEFSFEDVMNVLKNEILSITRVVLSDNTGLNTKSNKRMGGRQDYDFVNRIMFTISDNELQEEKIPDNLNYEELRKTISVIMGNIVKQKESK